MSKALALYAGRTALAQIKEQGISQEQFKLMVGASGGPKWFVLAGLDRYFCGEFLKNRNKPIYTLGSSAGAWRFSCYAQQDPYAAINRLIDGYSHLVYPKDAKTKQVTEQSEWLLNHVLDADGRHQIVDNSVVKNTIIVAKSLGLTRFEPKLLQLPGLLASAMANKIDRRKLGQYYQRVIFSSEIDNIPFNYHDGINSKIVELKDENIEQVLLATGSIPLIINGVKDISGAGKGMYRDGGIIDYHFDQEFLPSSKDGLVLYPHFYNEFKPGWFDKYVTDRFANKAHFDRTLVLAPTKEFVETLPFGKIPDRKDFTQLDDNQRIKYWQQVINASERLADEFDQLCNTPLAYKEISVI